MIEGLLEAISPFSLFLTFIGCGWGMIAGALPGLSASMAVILMMPFTYGMEAVQSLVVLVSVYVGAMCGGSISAILLRTPGTPSAVVTVFDGYPLAQQGKASRALGLAIVASAFGGIFSGIVLAFAAPLLARWALNFQSAEFFALALLGLSCTASIGSKSWSKALLSACIGLLLSTVGLDYMSGAQRFTFNYTFLAEGINYIPIMIGAYAYAEVYRNILRMDGKNEGLVKAGDKQKVKTEIIGIRHIIANWSLYLKSSIIGTIVGILPAAGGSIAAFISYGEARRSSKHPELFGHGSEEGVVAAEAANNAAVGGSLVPALTLGIPGSTVAALMLAAFTMHGLTPGPQLLRNQPTLLYCILWCIVIASLLLYVWGAIIAGQFAKIMNMPYPILGTVILALGLVGAYTLQSNVRDLTIMLIFSFLGVAFELYGYSVPTMILGMVLGPIAEKGFRKQLIVTRGDYTSFFTRPVCLVILIISVISFATPFIRDILAKRKKEKNGDATPA